MYKLENVSQTFKNTVLFHNISIELDSKTYQLQGANGSGKTTLLEIIAGLSKPTTGKITKPTKKGRTLYLGANGVGLMEMTIIDNIKMAYWVFKAKLKERNLQEIIHDLYPEEQLTHFYDTASHGMQLKLGLTLLYSDLNWDLIILDETLSGLDVESVQAIASKLKEFNCPKIIVSHQNIDKFFPKSVKLRLENQELYCE